MVAVAAAAILIVLVYLLTGGTLLTEKVTLYLYIPDATGLESGSAVRVNGTGVGKVDKVALSGSFQPNRIVRLTLKVDGDKLHDIPADSTAQISVEGVTGDKYVAVTQGTAAPRIRPNSEITYKAAPELLKTVDIQQFAQQLRQVDATLADIEQGKNRVGQFVKGREMYDGLRRALTEAERGFREAVSATGSAGRLLRTDEMYRRIYDPLAEIDDRLARIQSGQGEMGRLLREDGQYVQLRDQAARLRKSIADLRTDPMLTSDDLYVSWNRELGSLVARVDEINRGTMIRNTEAYDNLTGVVREVRSTVHQLRINPQKYLRIKLF